MRLCEGEVVGKSDSQQSPEEAVTNVSETGKERAHLTPARAMLLAVLFDHFLSTKYQTKDLDTILGRLREWSNRKRSLFSNEKFVEQALARLEAFNL